MRCQTFREVPRRWRSLGAAIGLAAVSGTAIRSPTNADAAPASFARSSGGGSPACALAPSLTAQQCRDLLAMRLPKSLPESAGNRFAESTEAARLGFKIFFDARFSTPNSVRCATCHLPENHFQDGKPVAMGFEKVTRNSPSLLNAARRHWLFWDGRADSLWSQGLFAFENPKEMNFTRLEIAHRIARSYRAPYEALFGKLPPLEDDKRFPLRGKPGEVAWEQMSKADREAVNAIAASVGKCLEAYVRKLAAGPAPFDAFLAGDAAALTPAQQRGMAVFMQVGCARCHRGPTLSDDAFHAIGVPATGAAPDRGRAAAIAILEQNEFNASGHYRDGPEAQAPAEAVQRPGAIEGAFLTPSLRNVENTGPYGHDGSFATLEDMVFFHTAPRDLRPVPPGRTSSGPIDPDAAPTRALTGEERADLVAFLRGLTGVFPSAPWSNWPDR